MSYGISVFSDSGYTQIDGNHASLVLHSSGVANRNTWISYSAGASPLIFVRPSTGSGIMFGELDLQNNQFYIISDSETFEWAIYRPSNEVSEGAGSWGVRVFNSTGARVFSSLQALPKYYASTVIDVRTQSATLSAPSGASPFALLNSLGQLDTQDIPPFGNVVRGPYYSFSGTSVDVYIDIYTGMPPHVSYRGPRFFSIIGV